MMTPFTADGGLDEGAAERLTDRLAAHGLHVFVLGTTGEGGSVPAAERRRLVEIARRVGRGRGLLYAGISANALAESVAAGRDYLQAGVDAVVAHPPWFFPLAPAEIEAWFVQLVRELRGPFLLYNIPQVTRHSVPVDVVARLADQPEVVGFKDSENTPGRMDAVLAALGGRRNFSLLMGTGSLSVEALRRGYHGLVPSMANVAPAPWRRLYDSARREPAAEADALQQRMIALAGVLQRGRSLGQSLAAMKAALHLQGIGIPAMLPPLQALDAAAISALAGELAALETSDWVASA